MAHARVLLPGKRAVALASLFSLLYSYPAVPIWSDQKNRYASWEEFMHLSTHNWMRAEPLETTLARISKFGYESIEISGEPKQYDTKETRKLLQKYGIRCWGSVTLTLGDRNLAARDEGQRARSVSYVKSVLDMIQPEPACADLRAASTKARPSTPSAPVGALRLIGSGGRFSRLAMICSA